MPYIRQEGQIFNNLADFLNQDNITMLRNDLKDNIEKAVNIKTHVPLAANGYRFIVFFLNQDLYSANREKLERAIFEAVERFPLPYQELTLGWSKQRITISINEFNTDFENFLSIKPNKGIFE